MSLGIDSDVYSFNPFHIQSHKFGGGLKRSLDQNPEIFFSCVNKIELEA